MNEIEIKLTEEEITCIIAALGMTMDISDSILILLRRYKVVKEKFTDNSHSIACTLALCSFHVKEKYM